MNGRCQSRLQGDRVSRAGSAGELVVAGRKGGAEVVEKVVVVVVVVKERGC